MITLDSKPRILREEEWDKNALEVSTRRKEGGPCPRLQVSRYSVYVGEEGVTITGEGSGILGRIPEES